MLTLFIVDARWAVVSAQVLEESGRFWKEAVALVHERLQFVELRFHDRCQSGGGSLQLVDLGTQLDAESAGAAPRQRCAVNVLDYADLLVTYRPPK